VFFSSAKRGCQPVQRAIFPSPPRTQRTPRRFGPLLRIAALGRLHIENEVNRCQQEVRSIGFDDERVDGLEGMGGEFHVVGQHDNRDVGPSLLDLVGDGSSIYETQVVLKHNRIHWTRQEKPQAIGTICSRCQLITLFFQ